MVGLGEALKNERKNRGITLVQISKMTNISLNILEALENEQFSVIPGKLHFTHFLKSYLNAIDIDEKIFLRDYKTFIDSIKFRIGDTYEIFQSLKYSRFKRRRLFFYILVFFILFILIFYLLYSNKDNVLVYFGLKSSKINIPESGVTPYPFEKQFSFDYWPINVNIDFIDNCWIQIYRGKEKIVENIFKKGEKIETGGYELTITMGNSAGVNFYLNGKKITYFKDSKTATRIYLNPNNVLKYLK